MTHANHSNHYRCRLMLGCALSLTALGGLAGSAAGQVPAPAAPAGMAAPSGPSAAAPGPAATHAPPMTPNEKLASPAPVARITNLVQTEASLLAHPDPKVRSLARKALESALAPPPNAQASPAYQVAFANSLNAALLPLFKSPDVQVRLNAAVVLGYATGPAGEGVPPPPPRIDVNNTALIPAILSALNDKAQPVVLWGVKAARGVLPRSVDNPPHDMRLAEALVKAVQRFPAATGIPEDAYDDFTANGTVLGLNAPANRAKELLPYVLQVLNARIDQYRRLNVDTVQPTDFPGAPNADNLALTFFSDQRVWQSATPAQRQQMMRAMIDLMSEMARLATAVTPRVAGNADPVSRNELADVIRQGGAAAQVILGRIPNATAAANAATALTKINPSTTLPQQMADSVAALEVELKNANLIAPPRPTPAPVAAPQAPVPATTRSAPPAAQPAPRGGTPASPAPRQAAPAR